MRTIKLFTVIFLCFALSAVSNAQQNITKYVKVYFGQPVDHSFAKGVSATYVKNAIMDTIAAYINRAKYTVDIAVYDYDASGSDTLSHLATAVNNAYSRGVKIRWIHDGSIASTGLSLLNSNIPVLTSPDNGSNTPPCYNDNSGIMHDKFVVIDAWDSLHAIVSTGSEDWSEPMNDYDYNNLAFIQSKVLARAYTNEFNIMWGDTTHGANPDGSNEKFGICKPNSGRHIFHIGGSEIELYFSPSDTVNTHVLSAINSAASDMYCAMYTYTEKSYATAFASMNSAGVYTSSVIDQYSDYGGNSAYTTMSGLPNFTEYTGSAIYHNKYAIVNPSNRCDDPTVITGSMNWTAGGYEENDENTIIIHNDTIANLYLQSYAGDYEAISGKNLVKQSSNCNLGINDLANNALQVAVYPNPFTGATTINYTLSNEENLTLEVYDIMGQKVSTLVNGEIQSAGEYTYHFHCPTPGVYILRMQEGQQIFVKKLVQE